MPYRTRSRSRSFRGNRDKYSIERTSVNTQVSGDKINGYYQTAIGIVPPTATQGMRKVKHVRISLSSTLQGEDSWEDIGWALVYVPEGYQPNTLDGRNEHSLYEPNQFVMASGFNDPRAGPIRITSPISRNLNSGDQIVLVVGTTQATTVAGLVEYAITLQ